MLFYFMDFFKFCLIGLLLAFILISGCITDVAYTDSSRDEKCFLEPDPGPCEAAMPRFYLGESGNCEQFLWGGCDGVVPFGTLEECRQACGITVVMKTYWEEDNIELRQNEQDGSFGCFGCNEPKEGTALCIDPILEMKQVEETPEMYCNSDFEIIESNEKTFCSLESRNTEACIEIYDPVCGWSDPEKIQCFTYPCASTFSNSCFACKDETVLFWTQGECPGPLS